MDSRTSTITLRIEKLRDAMKAEGVHAALVPSGRPPSVRVLA